MWEEPFGLVLHRGPRTDVLADALGKLLGLPDADPFVAEIVCVPTPGVERFLAQRLSRWLGTTGQPGAAEADGVCANVLFPSPRQYLAETVAARDADTAASFTAWSSASIASAVLDLLCEDLPLPITEFLKRPGTDQIDLSRRLASLYERYNEQRPSMIQAWARGEDRDGTGKPLPDDLVWQAGFWRRLRERIAEPSIAEMLPRIQQCLGADAPADGQYPTTPARVSFFGLTALPAWQRAAIVALAKRSEVHLWLPTVQMGPICDVTALSPRRHPGAGTLTEQQVHPLLGSWGRDSAELLQVVHGEASAAGLTPELLDHTVHLPDHDSLLTWLQCDLLTARAPDSGTLATRMLPVYDPSLQIRACHGPSRQVEVAREAILGLMEADPTLEPRDILIMAPDVAAYAPLMHAAFDVDGEVEAPVARMRLRIADRSPEQDNEVLTALSQLLVVVEGRAGASEVLDLAARGPVARQFGFDEAALERLSDLVLRAGIRWGWDGQDRDRYGLDGLRQNTWQTGILRLSAGVAQSEDHCSDSVPTLPYEDLESTETLLLGRAEEFLARLRHIASHDHPRPVAEWMQWFIEIIAGMTDTTAQDHWQQTAARSALLTLADQTPSTRPVTRAEARFLLETLLESRPGRINFRSGGATFCGMSPMRTIPYRVVCIMGLDDEDYPRNHLPDGDDILQRRPLLGEADPRSEDRQILLDATLAAQDALIITYSGFDPRTNEPLPPCVPISELLDGLALTASTAEGSVRDSVVHSHPLQPFDDRNYLPGALGPPGPFSHRPEALLPPGREQEPLPLLGHTRTAVPELDEVALVDLIRSMKDPAAFFLRECLGLSREAQEDPAEDRLPVSLDGLTRWQIGQRCLDMLLAGLQPQQIRRMELLRGELPVGRQGEEEIDEILGIAGAIAAGVEERRAGHPAGSCEIDIELEPQLLIEGSAQRHPARVRLVGVLQDVHGDRLLRSSYSRPDPKRELALWIELLALSVAGGGSQAVLVGKDDVRTLHSPVDARAVLSDLLVLHQLAGHGPLPLSPAVSRSFAHARSRGADPEAAFARIARVWPPHAQPRYGFDSPDVWRQLFGDTFDTHDLRGLPCPLPPSWGADLHVFDTLAQRVWDPILAAR